MTSIHSWLVRTGKYTILVDACSGNHKPRPGMPRFDMLNTQVSRPPARGGRGAGGDRLRDVHAPACRSRRLEHAAGERQVGADLPQRQVRDVAHRPRSLGGGGQEGRTPRPTRSTPTTIRCCRSSRRRRPSSCRASTRMCGCLTLKPAPGHTPGQIRVDLEFARQARDLRGRRAAQSGAGAAVEMEQLLLRGPRPGAQDAATRCSPIASSRARC